MNFLSFAALSLKPIKSFERYKFESELNIEADPTLDFA